MNEEKIDRAACERGVEKPNWSLMKIIIERY